ncbi:MAG: hypothetical protein IKW92_01815 [Firmicutes bacterium]|nr:hypothetical protein [Bacillota bacterium]
MNKSKKIMGLALTVCLMLVLLTGCVKIELDISIKSDGKADVSMIYAMADSALDPGDSAMSPDELAEYEQDGWSAEEYSQDGYTGVLLKKTDVDLSDEEILDGSTGSIRKEGNLYIVDLDVYGSDSAEDFLETASWLKSSGGSFIVRLHLPVKPETHNATTVSEDGKTLEWDILEMDGKEPIHVEFKTGGVGAALGSVGKVIGIVAAILVVIGVILVASKSRAKTAPDPFYPADTRMDAPAPEAPAPDMPAETPVPDIPAEAVPEAPAPAEPAAASFIPTEVTHEEPEVPEEIIEE